MPSPCTHPRGVRPRPGAEPPTAARTPARRAAGANRARSGARSRPRRARHVALAAALLAAALGWVPVASSQDATRDEGALLRKHSPAIREGMRDLPPFVRDTSLDLQLRTYYLLRERPDGVVQEAWAGGGWLAYRSGRLLDVLEIGATLHGAAPLHAPEDRDGTLLLAPGQEGYQVLGEAYAAIRYADYARLTGYRQTIVQGYINPEDNRMTPNTFEGVTLGGRMGVVRYLGGYLARIKPRNADHFRAMAREAGARGDDGVALVGIRLEPRPGLTLEVSEQYGIDTFNTVLAQADWVRPLANGLRIVLGAQFTDQRAVGDALLTSAAFRKWETHSVSGKTALAWRDLTVTVAGSQTGPGHAIQAPWGGSPSYLSLIQEDFQRAGERAVLVGVAYDFSKHVTPGLSAFVNGAWGWDAIDPKTRAAAPDQAEYDLTVDYRPPMARGLWLRLRGLVFDQEGGERLGYQVRLIVNWAIPLL